jgi:hypothetical protein
VKGTVPPNEKGALKPLDYLCHSMNLCRLWHLS